MWHEGDLRKSGTSGDLNHDRISTRNTSLQPYLYSLQQTIVNNHVRRLAGGNDAGDDGGDPPHVRRRAGRHVPLPCRPLAYAVGAVT